MKIVLVQTAIGDYRQKVLDILIQNFGDNFQVFAGVFYFKNSYKTSVEIKSENFTFIKNYFFFNSMFSFQVKILKPVLSSEIAILELNPRIISVWMLLIIRKFLGKKTIVWGHAWPRSGTRSKTDFLRHPMRILSNGIIVYTETQAKELKQIMPDKFIIAAPNSLYSADEMKASLDTLIINNIIYVGRISDDKKTNLLVDSFISIINQLPFNCNLILVGDGNYKSKLEEKVTNQNLENRIIFKGHINYIETLKSLYATAIVSVSPGYVGLSVTQSFSFGVPMIIARNEPHAPEIEAAVENKNCLYFESNSTQDLGEKILTFIREKELWINKREAIVEYCKNNYSVELMANRIIEAIKSV